MISILIILYILFIIISAYIDAEHINDKDYIENHNSRFQLRTVITLGFCFDESLYYLFDWKLLLVFILLFILLLDGILNKFRKRKWFYLGTVSKWDLFWKKRLILYKVVRTIVIIPIIYLIYLILQT